MRFSSTKECPLQEYKRNRSTDKTPEPFGGKARGSQFTFLVQKHAASHLHYDFRLEVKGVPKSRGIPKGPSMYPAIKHLAMLVEDHPCDYKDFEGLVPKGQNGGGTVIVWDEGTYRVISYVQKEKVRMDSRSAIDYTKRYPVIVSALTALGHDAVPAMVGRL